MNQEREKKLREVEDLPLPGELKVCLTAYLKVEELKEKGVTYEMLKDELLRAVASSQGLQGNQ